MAFMIALITFTRCTSQPCYDTYTGDFDGQGEQVHAQALGEITLLRSKVSNFLDAAAIMELKGICLQEGAISCGLLSIEAEVQGRSVWPFKWIWPGA